MSKNQSANIAIYNHTIQYCKKASFPAFIPFKHCYTDPDFSNEEILKEAVKYNLPAKILVENKDSFDLAREMEDGSGKIMVLNLASYLKAGGGVINGAQAQEEDLYRKSNYFESNCSSFYPLKMNEVVYSPLVYIIKDSEYQLLKKPYPVSCLAVAAIVSPKLKTLDNGKETYYYKNDLLIMQNKIDMIFKVAIKHEHKQLVLGAIGCGVFHNPVDVVAQMFKNSLEKYSQYFTRIGFAILSGPKNLNFEIFKDILLNTK